MQGKSKLERKTTPIGPSYHGKRLSGFTLVEVIVSVLLISLAVGYSMSSIIGITKGMNEDNATTLAIGNSSGVKNRLEQYIIEQVSKGSTAIPLIFLGTCGTADSMEQFICATNTELSNQLKLSTASNLTLQYTTGSSLNSQYCYLNAAYTVTTRAVSQTILQRNFVINCNAKKI